MLRPHVIQVADETDLKMLVTDPLFQIALDCFLIGDVANTTSPRPKPDMTMSRRISSHHPLP
jgi:hypothetical protein